MTTYIQTGSGRITSPIKPASRPRYNANSQREAIGAAARVSAKHGVLMYVYTSFGTSYGITWDLDSLSLAESYIEVDGAEFRFYADAHLVRMQEAS